MCCRAGADSNPNSAAGVLELILLGSDGFSISRGRLLWIAFRPMKPRTRRREIRILEAIRRADLLEVNGRFVVHSRIYYPGEPPAVTLTWFDYEGDEFAAHFDEESLRGARVYRGRLRLIDDLGEPVWLTCYKPIRRPFRINA